MLTDWIMIVITFVYVVATIVICISNKRSADAAKKQTEEMIKQYNESNRPYVIIKFEIIRSGLLCFVIENIGNMPAYELHIDLCREFIENIPDELMKCRVKEFVEAKEIYLAPKQKVFITLGGQVVYKHISAIPAEFELRYNSIYVSQFVIDLKQYGFMLTYESPEADIAYYMKKLQERQEKLGKEIIKSMRGLKNNNICS